MLNEPESFKEIDNGVHLAVHGKDANLDVTFYDGVMEVTNDSGQIELRPIDKVRIHISKSEVSDLEATEEHKRRFPVQWQRYKEGKEQVVGFRLSNWQFLTQGQRQILEFNKVFTVEQLAALSTQQIDNIGLGADALVEAAKAYLADKKGNAGVEAATKIKSQQAQIEQLQEQLAEMQEFMKSQKLEAGKAKKVTKKAE
jgi:hypothetical protein